MQQIHSLVLSHAPHSHAHGETLAFFLSKVISLLPQHKEIYVLAKKCFLYMNHIQEKYLCMQLDLCLVRNVWLHSSNSLYMINLKHDQPREKVIMQLPLEK